MGKLNNATRCDQEGDRFSRYPYGRDDWTKRLGSKAGRERGDSIAGTWQKRVGFNTRGAGSSPFALANELNAFRTRVSPPYVVCFSLKDLCTPRQRL